MASREGHDLESIKLWREETHFSVSLLSWLKEKSQGATVYVEISKGWESSTDHSLDDITKTFIR